MVEWLVENWVTLAVVLVALAVGWWVIKTVLRLTMRAFAMGCTGLVLLVGLIAGALWLGQ
jgi:hypothetical protein